MGKQRKPAGALSVETDVLLKLKAAGGFSPVSEARIAFMEAEGLARYARAMLPVGHALRPKDTDVRYKDGRVYPDVLPTAQSSFRTSTTRPSLVNFPARDGFGVAWGMILPDEGWVWPHFDMNALHARIAVAYTKDPVDREAFKNDWDIHTVTACGMFKHDLPPIRTKACHDSPECEAWRKSWDPVWPGEKDRRRRLAKVFRYALLLGQDERAALESKEVAKLNLTEREVLEFGRLYLESKPHMVQTKKAMFAKFAKERKARTFRGALRRLYGEDIQKGKDGWSHVLQGGEQDIMKEIIGDLHDAFDILYVLDSHDGYTFGMRAEDWGPDTYKAMKAITDRHWDIEGEDVWLPSDWEVILPDGTIQPLHAS